MGARSTSLTRGSGRVDLPFLRGLAERGFRSKLLSVYPAKTIPAWSCAATGQDPGALGVFGFTEPNGGPGKSRVVQTFRPAEAVWDRLSRRGVTVGVLNFPLRSGYAINGFVVPGMLSESSDTYPTRLRAELEARTHTPHVPELPHTGSPSGRSGSTSPPGPSTSTAAMPRSSAKSTAPRSSSRSSGRPTASSTSIGPS